MDKGRTSVSIDKELLSWLKQKVKDKVFGTKSHGFELGLIELKKKMGE